MNGYTAVAKILKKEGFEWMACFPANPLIEAVAKEGIRPITFRQERGGIMAADAYSRHMASKGKYGLFACQGGPGIENAFGAIAQAYADSVPLLFLPDGPGSYKSSVKPNFSGPQNYQHITKWSASITNVNEIPDLMRRAITALKNGRPGPVMLEMHRDVMSDEIKDLQYELTQKYISVPNINDTRKALQKILHAKKPVIWAGQGVLYSGGTKELQQLSELIQVPVITTMPGKSAFNEDHTLSLGSSNRTAPKPVWTWLKESDVIFAIGASLTVTNYGIDMPSGKFLIHSTNNVDDISKEYKTDIGLIGDAKETFKILIDEFKSIIDDPNNIKIKTKIKNSSIKEDIKQVKEEWMNEWEPTLKSNIIPINPYRVIYEINNHIDHETSVVTHDAGHPRDEIMPFYTASVPHSYIGWGKTTHLGYGIPLMIGAKMADPSKFCMNIMGDAAFGMSGLDIETSVRAKVPITTVVLNNGTMGGYNHSLPHAMEKYDAANMTGDYAKIAEGMGAIGIRIENPEEIGDAIKRAKEINFNELRSGLIDIKTQQQMEFSIYS